MSYFVTNNNTRRTKRSRVHHTFPDDTNTVGAVPFSGDTGTGFSFSAQSRDPHLVETTIGSHNSKGLVIVGSSALGDFHHPTNPDDRDIALGTSGEDGGLHDGKPNDTLANPPFPVTFTGPGYLAFQSGFSVPQIIGNTHIRGDLLIDGTLTVRNETTTSLVFAPVIQDALGNELTGVATVSNYVIHDQIHYLEALFTWTDFVDLDPTSAIRITGLPTTFSYTGLGAPLVLPHGGIATDFVGGAFHMYTNSGGNYLELQQIDMTTGAAPVSVLGSNFYGAAGSLQIAGWLLSS